MKTHKILLAIVAASLLCGSVPAMDFSRERYSSAGECWEIFVLPAAACATIGGFGFLSNGCSCVAPAAKLACAGQLSVPIKAFASAGGALCLGALCHLQCDGAPRLEPDMRR